MQSITVLLLPIYSSDVPSTPSHWCDSASIEPIREGQCDGARSGPRCVLSRFIRRRFSAALGRFRFEKLVTLQCISKTSDDCYTQTVFDSEA
jgi:hypothetical protein